MFAALVGLQWLSSIALTIWVNLPTSNPSIEAAVRTDSRHIWETIKYAFTALVRSMIPHMNISKSGRAKVNSVSTEPCCLAWMSLSIVGKAGIFVRLLRTYRVFEHGSGLPPATHGTKTSKVKD